MKQIRFYPDWLRTVLENFLLHFQPKRRAIRRRLGLVSVQHMCERK